GGGPELRNRVDAVHPRHLEVKQDDVRPRGLGGGHPLLRGSGHSNHLKVPVVLEDGDQSLTHHRVIVHDEDANHAVPSRRGTEATTDVPPPGRLSTRSVPPSSRARSRMPRIPTPPPDG